MSKPSIALVHDHLTQHGGAENVLLALQEIWPDAPTFTLVHDLARAHPAFARKDIRTSFIQKLPGGKRIYQAYLPLMPVATERYDLSHFDLVVSSASAFAKGVITRPETLHICYCHTPTRYLWTDTHSYVQELRYPWFVKRILPLLLTRLRVWDRAAADRVDRYVANSHLVGRRIKKYYRHQSTVIYPPVDITAFSTQEGKPGKYFLIGGRLVYYKRFDIAIQAFNKLGLPLKVFGTGPEMERLKALVRRDNIEFLGQVSDEQKRELYQNCRAFLHPHVEDFGITAVEALAAGRPVVALKAGGAIETIEEGVTGVFFEDQDWEALADTIMRTDWERFDPDLIHEYAQKFSKARFKNEMQDYVEKEWEHFVANSRQIQKL